MQEFSYDPERDLKGRRFLIFDWAENQLVEHEDDITNDLTAVRFGHLNGALDDLKRELSVVNLADQASGRYGRRHLDTDFEKGKIYLIISVPPEVEHPYSLTKEEVLRYTREALSVKEKVGKIALGRLNIESFKKREAKKLQEKN